MHSKRPHYNKWYIPNVDLYPFILGLNFIPSLQAGITMQHNHVSFHPKATTIIYTNLKRKDWEHNITPYK